MEYANRRKPAIILKFKNSTVAKKQTESDYSDDDDEVGQKYLQFGADCVAVKKNKTMTSGGVGAGGGGGLGKRETAVNNDGMVPPSFCQVDNCAVDLTAAKHYHRRHRVCEVHAKASVVVVVGLRQRFCQQCSRFHEVSEFDDVRRSCRNRLAGHNERRRKSYSEATQVIKGEQQSRSRSRSRSKSRSTHAPEFKSGW